MIERILVGVDGSRAATRAVALSQLLARRLGAELRALHVIDSSLLPQPVFETISESLGIAPGLSAGEARAGLEAMGRELLGQVETGCRQAGVSCRTDLALGRPAGVLLEHAAEGTLTVLGRSGTAHEDAGTTGAVVSQLLRTSTTPRLVVSEDAADPSRIVVGFDDSPAARAVLHLGARLAEKLAIPLHVVHVARQSRDPSTLPAAESQLALFDSLAPKFERHLGSPAAILVERYSHVPGTILALGARGLHRLADRILGTTTEQVHRHTPATLLVDG